MKMVKAYVLFLTAALITGCHQDAVYDKFESADNIQPRIGGFDIQVLHRGEGEYLSMAFDPQGRLLISPRYGKLLRMTISSDGSKRVLLDTIDAGVTDCQGMLYAYHSLYMMGTGPEDIRGIYRLLDEDSNGRFGEPTLMLEMPRNGDHSGHTLTLGPDQMIYFLTGNDNKPPHDDHIQYIHQNWATDHLLPLRSIYGSSQGPPGGFVMRTDSIGSMWQFYAYGLRNPYDMAFHHDGELFTFDSDMEWDYGLPWYRATRVNHIVSGADFAWREVTAKRFDYYPDVWPAVIDLGRGSPTGVVSGNGTWFPEKYQKAMFLGDWSFGKIYALFLTPDGASYRGEIETFATGKPLNVTDMAVGPDGALYFVTGGNGTDTGLFRIISTQTKRPGKRKINTNKATRLRKKLESHHFRTDSSSLSLALTTMNHEDRHIRLASRTIVEKFPLHLWRTALEKEQSIDGKLNYLTALIRGDTSSVNEEIIVAQFAETFSSSMSEDQLLGFQRLISLFLVRYKGLTKDHLASIYGLIKPHYPARNDPMNKELSRNLGYMATKGFDPTWYIETTLGLVESSTNQEQLIHYLEMMRHIPDGWSVDHRLAYYYWMDYAMSNFRGGSLFQYFLGEIKKDFETTHRIDERDNLVLHQPKMLTKSYSGPFTPVTRIRGISDTSSVFVKNWEFEDLQYVLELVNSPRNPRERDFHRGKRMFEKGLCYNCHQMLGKGGSFGPEMTYAGNSFGIEQLTRTILYPSETINSRFQATDFRLKDDITISGRVLSESDAFYVISKDWTGTATEEIPKNMVVSSSPSDISEMTPGLVNGMEKDEILDLLYFITEVPSRIEDPMAFDIFESKTAFHKSDSSYVELVNYNGRGELRFRIATASDEFKIYEGPFYVHKTSVVEAYKWLDGDLSETKKRTIHAYEPKVNGLRYVLQTNASSRFEIDPDSEQTVHGTVPRLDVRDIIQDQNNFNITFSGMLDIEQAGEYTFYANYDDAIRIYLNNVMVADDGDNNWGGSIEFSIRLQKGKIPFRLAFYDQLSTEYLFVEYEGPGIDRMEIPAHKFLLAAPE